MSIEQDLTRIATALEVIANNIAAVGQQMGAKAADSASMPAPAPAAAAAAAEAPAAEAPAAAEEDTRSPQQKAADTRKANKAKKEAEAKTPPPLAVVPTPAVAPAAAPVAAPPVAAAPAAPVEGVLDFPADLPAMTQLVKETYAHLEQIEVGKGLKEVGKLMVGTYGVDNVSALSIDYYAGFARDLRALVSPA